jgi:hypothetical protein
MFKISYEEFNQGIFPWETVQQDDTQFPKRKLENFKIIFLYLSQGNVLSFKA